MFIGFPVFTLDGCNPFASSIRIAWKSINSPNSRRSPCKHPKYHCFHHSSTTSNTLAGFPCSTIPPGIPIIDPVLYSSVYVPCPNMTKKTHLRASLWFECPDRYELIASQSIQCSLTRLPPICCQGFTARASLCIGSSQPLPNISTLALTLPV